LARGHPDRPGIDDVLTLDLRPPDVPDRRPVDLPPEEQPRNPARSPPRDTRAAVEAHVEVVVVPRLLRVLPGLPDRVRLCAVRRDDVADAAARLVPLEPDLLGAGERGLEGDLVGGEKARIDGLSAIAVVLH